MICVFLFPISIFAMNEMNSLNVDLLIYLKLELRKITRAQREWKKLIWTRRICWCNSILDTSETWIFTQSSGFGSLSLILISLRAFVLPDTIHQKASPFTMSRESHLRWWQFYLLIEVRLSSSWERFEHANDVYSLRLNDIHLICYFNSFLSCFCVPLYLCLQPMFNSCYV